MFTDIEGSTRLARMLGESYSAVLGAHRSVLRAALSNFGGHELFTEGDSFFVAFGDASAAIAACVAAQRALAAHDWPTPDARPRVRMGLHTGWAMPANGEYVSAEVHRAARVAAAAHGSQVLCSEATALAATTWPAGLTGTSPSGEELDGEGLSGEGLSGEGLSGEGLSGEGLSGEGLDGEGLDGEQQAGPGQSGARLGRAGRVAMTGVDLLDLGPHKLRGFDDAERLFQLVASGLERDFPRPRTPGAPTNNLPASLTPFVGRRAERDEVTALVARHRLVTVAGPGGIGKSRLALAAADELLVAYPDGVWIVDAASVRGATGLPGAIAGAVGLRTEPGRPLLETVLEHCAARRMLLLVETVEAAPTHVAATVRRLLTGCPDVSVLATGREPLGIHGEVVWRVPPMAPADAFTLLSSRTTDARGGRPIARDESGDLARVASGLDGSPLAIELAAARLRLLCAAELAARLDDPARALDATREAEVTEPDDRHRSLTASLDWSYRSLGDRASGLLRRLAVFAGAVDLSAVEWFGDDALAGLTELADKSLIEVLPGSRFRLSKTIRGYAAGKLAAAGDERAARNRHTAWALHTLDSVAVDTDGQPRTVSLTDLAPYVDEWQAALRWSAGQGSVRAGLRLAGALDPWWREHGGAWEGRDLLFRLYARLSGEHIAPAELASAYLVHAGLANDRDERQLFLSRAEEIARRVDHPALLVRSLAGRRIGLRPADAEQVCRDVIARAERTGVPSAALPSVVALAELLWHRGALDEAAELLGGARQVEAGRPADRGRRTVDWLLGLIALRRGDLVAAHDHLVVALRSRLRHGFRGGAADAVAALAVRCAMGGDHTTSARLFGGSEGVRGVRRAAVAGGFWVEQQAQVRAAIGDAAFDAAYVDGAGQGFDRIVAAALAVEHPDLEYGSARFAPTMR
ncbi:adenylate/guanylate cyclase domain-containing protein [Actinoplanes sp. NBRC 103695]|uniref:adenylate/guanylate cyclase domain-containing protein n=1 Tax=Actinoplanes sp. NBRC 103695 TaxID=3032202 RepID=UPI0025523B6B|nr:adenylate/guanylate cyclase domain-containing protein [Actinoplanes sp. NBRC 103695]